MKRKILDLFDEIRVDSFAGGGGASLGMTAAGFPPDVAINHDEAAIAMHKANHPGTTHFTESVWKVSPHTVTKGRPVGLLWASPDCCHFSRAKGAKPVKKEIRSLAWVVVKWAAEVRPRVIILENVREFEDWGPLLHKHVAGKPQYLPDGSPVLVPDPNRLGHSFKRWAGRLRGLGYDVQWRVLNAADYGAPTHRRRLFVVARCDGQPIVWPTPTHCEPKKVGEKWYMDGKDPKPLPKPRVPYRTAAECIDWSLPCPSIFMTKDEAKAWAKANNCAPPQRPLAENTLRRIAMGIKRYVLDCKEPFIVVVNHGGQQFRGQGLGEPLQTISSKHGYGIVTPLVAKFRGQSVGNSVNEPLSTITSGAGAARPAGAAHAMALVAPVLSKFHGQKANESRCGSPADPLATLDTSNRFGLCAAFLAKHFGGVVGQGVQQPFGTVTAKDHHSLVAANLIHLNHGDKQWNDVREPLRTATTGNHAGLIYSFLTKYQGTAVGQGLKQPLWTATAKDRFGLVTVTIAGETWVIIDIGMRMLTPRELARAQGFPDSYILTGSKSSQVARIGNSVAPVMAEVLVRANYKQMNEKRKAGAS